MLAFDFVFHAFHGSRQPFRHFIVSLIFFLQRLAHANTPLVGRFCRRLLPASMDERAVAGGQLHVLTPKERIVPSLWRFAVLTCGSVALLAAINVSLSSHPSARHACSAAWLLCHLGVHTTLSIASFSVSPPRVTSPGRIARPHRPAAS